MIAGLFSRTGSGFSQRIGSLLPVLTTWVSVFVPNATYWAEKESDASTNIYKSKYDFLGRVERFR